MYGSRSNSPIFRKVMSGKKEELEMLPNGYHDNNQSKIHRIHPTRSMSCIVSYVISPSCIWLKPVNHITDQLKLSDLTVLRRPPSLRKKQYVLAPISEGCYARARIISKCEKFRDPNTGTMLSFSRVHFIDEGFCRWVGDCCLAEMDEELFFYPYQAVACTLYRVSPKAEEWTAYDVDLLRTILFQYNEFFAKVIITETPYMDYCECLRVELFADMDGERNCLVSIAPEFFRQGLINGCGYEYDRNIYDGFSQRIFPVYDDEIEFSSLIYENMPHWEKTFPEEPGVLDVQEVGSDDSDAQVDAASFDDTNEEMLCVDENYLRSQGYWGADDRLYINVEGLRTRSPYEFYGRFLKVGDSSKCTKEVFRASGDMMVVMDGDKEKEDSVRDEEDDPMMAADGLLKKLAKELNTFYGLSGNRKMIKANKVTKALAEKRTVYGVVEVTGDVARFTGCWQRVEILGVKDSVYAHVRFIDAGGTDIILLSSVLQLNTKFYSRPPLCFQMCIYGIKPPDGIKWGNEAKKFFCRELRDDVPISLRFWRFSKGDKNQFGYSCPPYLRNNVVLVSELQVKDMARERWIEKRLISKGYAVEAADVPLPKEDK